MNGGRVVGVKTRANPPCNAVVCCSRPCSAARSGLIGCTSTFQRRRVVVSPFKPQLALLVSPPPQPAPLHRSVAAHAKQPGDKQDPFVLQSVDNDPAIDALIFEEDTAVMAERALETAAAYVGAAVLFGIGVWFFMGPVAGQEFFAGYLLEQSLSIDNLFVFILVFKYFKTPVDSQRTVLFWGILTAAVLRLVMIVLGVELIQVFEPLLLIFAGILLFSSYKLLMGADEDEDDDLSDNTIVKLCRRFIKVTDRYDGTNFLTQIDGVRVFTPLVLVLAVIEISDVIFAVDSIPAVFGITLNPFIVYTSNIFAIISLRAFYSFIAVFMEKLRFLDKAVALVLGFIGLKMVVDYFAEGLIPTWAALLVVGGLLGAGVAVSLLLPPEEDGDEEDASSQGDTETGSTASGAERETEDENAQLLDPQGTTKKRGSNGKGRASEDGEALLVVVPDEPEDAAATTDKGKGRRSLEGASVSPTDSMDENAVGATSTSK